MASWTTCANTTSPRTGAETCSGWDWCPSSEARRIASYDRSIIVRIGKRIEIQFFHRIVLEVVGEEGEPIINRHGSDSHISRSQSGAFAAVVALQQTSQAGDWPNDWIVLQTMQQ